MKQRGITNTRILVVEDEGIIAQDIKNCLENLGYEVPDIVFTGPEAIEKAKQLQPDLVLMDIVLKGEMDGIETASEIRNLYNIPIVYLTAYEDDKTLSRAKITEPLGYILKPFEERYLRSNIEMALYKHKMEQKLKQSERWLSTILKSVGDAVIVTDTDGKVTYINPKAEQLIGYTFKEIYNKHLDSIIKFISDDTRFPIENPVNKVLKENVALGRSNHTTLVVKDGIEISIDHSASPILDEKGNITGSVLILHDVTDRIIAENALKESENKYRNLFDYATDAIFVLNINGDILSVNNRACGLLGYTKDELYSTKFSMLLEEGIPLSATLYQSLKERGEFRTETNLKKKNSDLAEVELNAIFLSLLDEQAVQIFARDISFRKKSEKEISMLAHAIRSISECVSITDMADNILYVNDAFIKTYGFAPEELIGKKLQVIRSPKNPHEIYDKIHSETLKGGWQGELLNRKTDGTEFPIYLSTSIVRDETGKPVALVGVSTDISERKQLESALTSSEEEYRNLFENSLDAILIISRDEIILDVNRSACEIYGFRKEEFIGMSLSLISKNGDSSEKFLSKLRNTGDSLRFECIHYKKDGTLMHLEVSTRLIDYKGKQAFVSINRDVTQYKKAIDALLLSEKRFQDLYDSAPDMYFSVNREGIVNSVNKSGAEYLGYSKEELYGNSVYRIVFEEDKKLVKSQIEKIFSEKLESGEIEFRKVKKDGTVIWVVERTRLIYNAKGEANELFIICRDITERKKSEAFLHERENLYRSIFENVPAIKFVASPESEKIIEANDAASGFFGMTIEELKANRLRDLLMLSVNELKKLLNDITRQGSIIISLQAKAGNNTVKDVEIFACIIRYQDKSILYCILQDITGRKKSEQKLLDIEKRYRTLTYNAPLIFTRFNLKSGKYDFVNEQFSKISGWTLEELNSLSATELRNTVYEEDRTRIGELCDNWKSSGYKGTIHAESRVYTKNRNVVWLDTYTYADFDNLGNPESLNQMSIDITDRKIAESLISEKEQKYRNLAQNAPIAVTRINMKDKNYDYVNEEFTRQSGYTMEEFNKLSDEELIEMIYPDDQERVFSFYKDWEAKGYYGTQRLDYRIINRNGKTLWLDTYIYAETDENGKANVINQICIDVTEQKKTREELGESQSRFRALIENSTDMIALLDRDLKMFYISPSANRILGFKNDLIENKIFTNFIHPDDLDKVKSVLNELMRSKGKLLSSQYRFKKESGFWVWVEGSFRNLLDDEKVSAVILNFRDITERKRAEEELRLQKSYFQQLFENSPEAIVILDNNDKVSNINKGFEKLFQYSLDELKGKNINKLLVPENLLEQAKQMSQFVLDGDIIQKETQRKRKDNSLVSVSILAYPIMIGSEQVGVYGIYNDISGRKESEKALKTSEERYKAFVQQSSEGIWRFEFLEPVPASMTTEEQLQHIFKYGYLAECNDVFAFMYGYKSAEEISGVRLNEIFREDNGMNSEYLKRFIESEYRLTDNEQKLIGPDSSVKYFVNNLVGIIENGHLVRAWGTRRDVTAARKAEEELKLTQFRLATLLGNLPDVVLYETGASREFISENVINLLGYPASRFVNDRNFFPSIVHPGDYKEVQRKNAEWQQKGRPGILNMEFRCRRADGIYIWIEDHMVSVKALSEKEHMAGVLLDINERKKSEDKLKQLAEKLALSNKELEQFAYVASHDLQEPLRMVASYIQLLQRRYKDKLGDEADEFINFAVDGVIRMKALINDLLIYSRVNTQEFPYEKVDCNVIVKQVISNLKATIDENNAVINCEKLPVVMSNPLQMSQIFQNLISNAIKFHGEKPPVVTISTKRTSDEWIFSVADNGIGIENEFAERIFVIFQRLHTYNEYPGTGIGLAICKKIIEKLGGHIWVESERGKGSTFNFTIPIDKETIF